MKTFKEVMLEIAKKRQTNIYGLAEKLSVTNQTLYATIAKKSLTVKKLQKWIEILELSDSEILDIVKSVSEYEVIKNSFE